MIEEAPEPSFCSFHFADARISTLMGGRGTLRIRVVDWREVAYHVEFTDVAGYEVTGAEGEDLSHGSIIMNDPLHLRLQQSIGASPRSLHCIALWSAWDDRVVLRVVAAAVAITPAASNAAGEEG